MKTKEIVEYIDSLSNLNFVGGEIFKYSTEFDYIPYEEYIVKMAFGEYYIRYSYYDKLYSIYLNSEKLFDNIFTIEDAEKKANEDYKSRIKKALKL